VFNTDREMVCFEHPMVSSGDKNKWNSHVRNVYE